ncbi:MAG: hypothetical protein V7746_01835 [Halioglobus sp.]
MKKLGIIALSLIIVIGAVVYLLLGNLDDIVERTVEQVGSELIGTEVQLDSVALDLGSGTVTLSGLQIDNPKGYKSDYAFLLKQVTVALNPGSLGKPVIQLDKVIVRGARLNVEQRGDSTNLSDLLAHVENGQKGEPAKEEKTQSSSESDVRLTLKRFIFAGTKATLISDASANKPIKVPDVKRSNIGNPKQGLTPEQLGDALLQAVLEEVQVAVADHLAGLAKQALEDQIREKIGLPKKE